jgi:broad-specificity NMP kinase
MIRLKQPGLRAVIAQDAALSKWCRPLDDTTVLVLPANLKKLRKRLKELGYLLG